MGCGFDDPQKIRSRAEGPLAPPGAVSLLTQDLGRRRGGPGACYSTARFGGENFDKECSMPEDVKAHITGVVFQITSKPGDAVTAGDPIIVLESMKMEIPVEAPRSGRIKEITVTEGQTVQEGDTLAVLE